MAVAGGSARAKLWAWIGGFALAAGVIAIVVVALTRDGPSEQSASPSPERTHAPTSSITPSSVVDAGAYERGWAPEPISTNPALYAAAALEAAATFDTTKASRDEWLAHLDSWFTPDTRYATGEDQQVELEAARLELRQGVVLPEQEWDSLAAEDGRVVADAGRVATGPVTDDVTGDMTIATADVVLTFTRTDGSGGESTYEESVRVSVQVLCGPGSVPTPDSTQQAGDCKVVRYFMEPVEP